MVGWHNQLSAFEQAPGVGDRQGCVMCCNPWVAEFDMTEQLN